MAKSDPVDLTWGGKSKGPSTAPVFPAFEKGVSPSPVTVGKRVSQAKRTKMAVEKAKQEGYAEALAKFTPDVIRRVEKQGKLLDKLIEKLNTAILADDYATIRALQPTVAMLKGTDEKSMDRAHGTAVAKSQVEQTNINVGVEVTLDQIEALFPSRIAEPHEHVIEAEVAEVIEDDSYEDDL